MELENLSNENNSFSTVSLFAGAGGLDMGFEKHGFKILWANDIDEDACKTHELWSDAAVACGDITENDFSSIPECQVILGGFPCQGFSLAGPRKIDDRRNKLYRYFCELVVKKQPLAFVAENVKGILTLGNGAIVDAIIQDFKIKGYDVFYKLLNAADYGVPQDRWRIFMVGFRQDLQISNFEFPVPFTEKVTVKDALQGILEPGQSDICKASFSSRYMSRNRKRNWDEVSFTIPAMAKQVPLHPASPDMVKLDTDLWKFGDSDKTRRLSWQEAAAIQTFPPSLNFVGSLDSKYRQIGNAVPVKLAEAIACKVYDVLNASKPSLIFDFGTEISNTKTKKKAKQADTGKAFEYACLNELLKKLSEKQQVAVKGSSAVNNAKKAYESFDNSIKDKMNLGANAAIKVLFRLEPFLENPLQNIPLYLSIQADAKGQDGDVRDILAIRRQNDWEIGISCKHNHSAVKHSRLSRNIDFGEKWFGIPCSNSYFDAVNPIFDDLDIMKSNKMKWSEIEDKENRIYRPILKAFIDELKRLDKSNPGEIPKLLLSYLLGKNDFYKVISIENRRVTQIQAFSLYGTLNRTAGNTKPQVKLPQLSLPNKFYDIDFKPNSVNTVHVVCSEGWTISLRIHNAKTAVEPSLKFDAQLIGVPPALYTHFEPWT